jgi:sulfur transfer protein SufE
MQFYLALFLLLAAPTNAFVVGNQPATRLVTQLASSNDSKVDLGLTPELQRVTDAFSAIADEQTRYKQLLYMAQNTEKANSMPDSSKIPANKVPGCLSTVFIDGKAIFDKEKGDYVIDFIGDSDGLLTKGLVALLVR